MSALTATSNDTRSDTSRAMRVFAVALLIRLALAAIFLGYRDSLISITYMPVAARHGSFPLPYFPMIQNWTGLAALLDAHWISAARSLHVSDQLVPLALFQKLLPCLADSLLAAWFALDTRLSPLYRKRAAWIYALCPLAILVCSFRGQWDSVWMLFALTAFVVATRNNPSRRSQVVAGSLFALAVLVKPTPLILFPLLLTRLCDRKSIAIWWQSVRHIVFGFLATMAAAFLWFDIEGINLVKNIHRIIRYGGADQSTVPLGLTRITALNHFGNATHPLRNVAFLLALGVIAYFHFGRRRAHPMAAAAAVVLILPGVGGLDYQYMLWAIPFMIAAGRLRMSVVYGLVCALVDFLYGVSPGMWLINPAEERYFLAPIKPLRFLAIPNGAKTWLAGSVPVDIWRVLNFAMPALMVALAIVLVFGRQDGPPRVQMRQRDLLRRTAYINGPVVLLFAVSGVLYLLGPYLRDEALIQSHLVSQLHGYALRTAGYPRNVLLLDLATTAGKAVDSGAWWGTALVLLPLASLMWGVFAWRNSRTPVALGAEIPAHERGLATVAGA